MDITRRSILTSLPAASLLSAAGLRAQEAWPARPIRIINPWPAGGPADALIRPLAEGLRPVLGQNVLVENQPGANGTIATANAAKAAPDGYTLMYSNLGPMTVSPAMVKLPYDPIRDLAPITQLTRSPLVLTVRDDLPVRSVDEFIRYARAQARPLIMGSVGNGSTTHVVGEMFKAASGLDFTHVPYKGSDPLLVDMAGGRIDYSFLNYLGTVSYSKSGKVRVLAASTLRRSDVLPDLPAISETLPGFDFASWYGLHAPAAVPAPILDTIYRATVRVLNGEEFRQQLRQGYFELVASTPQQFGERVRMELEQFTRLVRTSGMATG
jgi:tripartite-type tricarboxylate transporter receptor subunit TctC